MKTKQFILLTAVLFLFLTVNPQNAYCQWASQSKYINKSDELPGMLSGGEVILITGGVIITGLITYLIVKKSKDNKSSSYSIGDKPGYLLAQSFPTESGSFYDEMKNASQHSSVEIFTGKSNSKAQMDYNFNTGLAIGVRFKF